MIPFQERKRSLKFLADRLAHKPELLLRTSLPLTSHLANDQGGLQPPPTPYVLI